MKIHWRCRCQLYIIFKKLTDTNFQKKRFQCKLVRSIVILHLYSWCDKNTRKKKTTNKYAFLNKKKDNMVICFHQSFHCNILTSNNCKQTEYEWSRLKHNVGSATNIIATSTYFYIFVPCTVCKAFNPLINFFSFSFSILLLLYQNYVNIIVNKRKIKLNSIIIKKRSHYYNAMLATYKLYKLYKLYIKNIIYRWFI